MAHTVIVVAALLLSAGSGRAGGGGDEGLQDGSRQLVRHTEGLQDGSRQMVPHMEGLQDGSRQLVRHTEGLQDGSRQLVPQQLVRHTEGLQDGSRQMVPHTEGLQDGSRQMVPHMEVLEDEWRWWSFLSCLPADDSLHCLARYLAGYFNSSTPSSDNYGRHKEEEEESSSVLGKPLMLMMMLRSKLGMLLMKMSLALQVKLLLLSLASLLLNLYRVLTADKSPRQSDHQVHYLHGAPGTPLHAGASDTGWMGELWENTIRDHQAGLPHELHHSFFYNNPRVPAAKRHDPPDTTDLVHRILSSRRLPDRSTTSSALSGNAA